MGATLFRKVGSPRRAVDVWARTLPFYHTVPPPCLGSEVTIVLTLKSRRSCGSAVVGLLVVVIGEDRVGSVVCDKHRAIGVGSGYRHRVFEFGELGGARSARSPWHPDSPFFLGASYVRAGCGARCQLALGNRARHPLDISSSRMRL